MNQPLYPEDWQYFAEGEVHFILSYIGTNPALKRRVLRIKKQKTETDLERDLDHLLSSIYAQYLCEIKLFANYFLQSSIVYLSKQQRIKFLTAMWQKLRYESKSQKKVVGIDLQADIEMMIDLTDALLFKNYTCLIELKPKSPIYDRYQLQTFSNIAGQNNLTSNQLTQIIEKLPQKYKIQKIKKEIVNNKIHNNRLESCEFYRGQSINYLGRNKNMAEMYFSGKNKISIDKLPIQELQLNTVIHQILSRQDIFNKLLAPIHLYAKSYSRLKIINKQIIIKILKQNNHTSTISKLTSQTLQNFDNKSYLQSSNPIDLTPIPTCPQTQLNELLQFLISSTFRDISIFLKIQIHKKQSNDQIQINQEYSATYKLIILDYELKSVYRVREKYLNEDEQNLRKMLPLILKNTMVPENDNKKNN